MAFSRMLPQSIDQNAFTPKLFHHKNSNKTKDMNTRVSFNQISILRRQFKSFKAPQATAKSTATSETNESKSKDINDEVQAVLFDMDGVLCNSEDRSREAAVSLFSEMGVEVKTEDFVPFMGTGEANFLGGVARLYKVETFDPVKAKARFFEIYIEKYAKPNSGLEYDGALQLIFECKKAGLKVAVASSADRVKVDANLAASGIDISLFDAVVSADLFERLKPFPDIFLSAAQILNVSPRNCVVIEDALAGIQAATSAGMRSIAVTTTLSEAEIISSVNPGLIKKDISHIKLEDIFDIKYKNDGNAVGAEGKETVVTEEGGKSFFESLDSTLTLPGGVVTTRRNVIRSASLALGVGTTFFTLTHLKALSYASPKAILNLIFGDSMPKVKDFERERQVANLKKYIAELDQKGGGTQVPEFKSGLEWLNSPPLKLQKELRGKIVLLDFWTYCCINCMHVLPDLAFLEKKYKNMPVEVVGVHSAKFDNEKDLEAIRSAVLRYDVEHPVVNDGEMTLWRALGVSSWPTLILVGPTGRVIGTLAGEGHREDLDCLIEASLEYYGEKGELSEEPIPIALEKFKDQKLVNSPLKFPGKIASDLANGRLFISDSNNHRIVVTDLSGKFLLQVGGAGGEGLRDGPFEFAAFNRPQGIAYNSAKNVLYVADTENHAVREVDFVNETVKTLAGNGTKGRDYVGGKRGKDQELNSPWDVSVGPDGSTLFIAMAGQHQIWKADLESGIFEVFSGTGYERNQNGSKGTNTAYAQPSGLSLSKSGEEMFIADSESSSIRALNLKSGGSRQVAGGDPYFADNLFKFGDKDGFGSKAELQHPLGVLAGENGEIYVADSYNHKIKLVDPVTSEVKTLVGNGTAGFQDGEGLQVQLSEPAGLALGPNGSIFVADTNNSVIRLFYPETRTVATLDLSTVPPPPPELPAGTPRRLRKRQPVEAEVVEVPTALTSAEGTFTIQVKIPEGYHFTTGASSRFDIEGEPEDIIEVGENSGKFSQSGDLAVTVVKYSLDPKFEGSGYLRVVSKIYYCEQDEVCLYKGLSFRVPILRGEVSDAQKNFTFTYEITARK